MNRRNLFSWFAAAVCGMLFGRKAKADAVTATLYANDNGVDIGVLARELTRLAECSPHAKVFLAVPHPIGGNEVTIIASLSGIGFDSDGSGPSIFHGVHRVEISGTAVHFAARPVFKLRTMG